MQGYLAVIKKTSVVRSEATCSGNILGGTKSKAAHTHENVAGTCPTEMFNMLNSVQHVSCCWDKIAGPKITKITCSWKKITTCAHTHGNVVDTCRTEIFSMMNSVQHASGTKYSPNSRSPRLKSQCV